MAYYKYGKYLTEANLEDFDNLYDSTSAVPYSGIYRCEGCGREEVSVSGTLLPGDHSHQHSAAQGPILWRLVVGRQSTADSNG